MKLSVRDALPMLGVVALALAGSAHSAAISNGSFETGFSGWSLADQVGSAGGFQIQSGTSSPVLGDTVPAPTAGSNAAMSDADAPGSHVLYQDFVATADAVRLNFDLYIGNRGPEFVTLPTLSFDGNVAPFNQQVRVDLVSVAADPFSVAAGDVLQNLYQSQPGDPLESGYTTVSVDVSAVMATYAGQTVRLRFAEVDSLPLQMGIDNVNIAAVP